MLRDPGDRHEGGCVLGPHLGAVVGHGEQDRDTVVVVGDVTGGELSGDRFVLEEPRFAVGVEGVDERVLDLDPGFLRGEHGR